MYCHLGGSSYATNPIHYIMDTGSNHDMEPKYVSLLSYHRYFSGDYVTFVNGAKEPILLVSPASSQSTTRPL